MIEEVSMMQLQPQQPMPITQVPISVWMNMWGHSGLAPKFTTTRIWDSDLFLIWRAGIVRHRMLYIDIDSAFQNVADPDSDLSPAQGYVEILLSTDAKHYTYGQLDAMVHDVWGSNAFWAYACWGLRVFIPWSKE